MAGMPSTIPAPQEHGWWWRRRGDKVLMVVVEEEDFHGWVVGGSGAGSGDDGVFMYPAV